MRKIKVAPSLPENVEVNEIGENRAELLPILLRVVMPLL